MFFIACSCGLFFTEATWASPEFPENFLDIRDIKRSKKPTILDGVRLKGLWL